ncbi:uncharacterized protein LOC101898329 [Musca domestica]|uniref:Uncharacterized protein LOC101898329 n=1 Tax=Musca domestica TaxID=7370 RepID=A0ABM3VLF1_MUSDO|nr:uncharacterized protein LOC101898329 [Musca domestica]
MDYQIVFKCSTLLKCLLIFSIVNCVLSIVNRDLVLTPKQGLQLSGKRIYYDENAGADATTSIGHSGRSNSSSEAASSVRPWERTLKHVTYLTLFTNTPNGIITGNFSKVREYNEFLQSPYLRTPKPIDSRFGDIVTLAQGRLESLTNGSYRFVEGNCDYACARENKMVATWHVQKIRHRDVDRKFHYEIKFSVSPMTATQPSETVVRGGPNKRTAMDNNNNALQHKSNNIQTFIQKEDDYPHSFSKLRSIANSDDDGFVERRYDGSRNIRQFNPGQQHTQITPMPQSTFLRGIYRPPPPQPVVQHAHHPHLTNSGPPLPDQLNIGEYYKGSYGPKASSKIELFPNLLTMMFGKPHIYPKYPTTYRPHNVAVEQQIHFPRPEAYTAPAVATVPQHLPYVQQQHHHPEFPAGGHFIHGQEYTKIPEYYQSHEHITSSKEVLSPVITHHYHHHFFMTNSSDSEEHSSAGNRNGGNGGGSEEEQNVNPNILYKTNVHVVTPQPEQAVQVSQTNEEHKPHIVLAHQILQQQYQVQQQQQQQLAKHQPPQHHEHQHLQFPNTSPAPQKFVFPIAEIEQHRVVHVTPVPPLRKPQYQQHHYQQPYVQQQYSTAHAPIAIYPAPVEEQDKADIPTPRSKPFIQSQPMDEEPIRYSEPDPLYANVDEHQEDQVTYVPVPEEEESQEPQLEEPQHYENHPFQETERTDDTTKQHSESIEAQVPAPQQGYAAKNSYETSRHDNEDNIDTDNEEHEASTHHQGTQEYLEENTSQSTTTTKASTHKSTDNNIDTETEANKATLAATPKPKPLSVRGKRVRVKVTKLTSSTTTKPKLFSTRVTTEKEILATTPISTTSSSTANSLKEQKQFISTSTTESPLKSLSRYRNTNKRLTFTTTTTEKPVLKWKPRRKEATAKALSLKNFGKQAASEQKNQATIREVTKANNIDPIVSTTETQQPDNTLDNVSMLETTSTTMSSLIVDASLPPATTSVSETYEVLTQKSISYKVGENGEEIPLLINDSDNEVKAL